MAKDLPVTLDGKVIYHIKLTDSFQGLAEELKQLGYQADQKICIISDSNVAKLYAETVKNILTKSFPQIFCYEFQAGEASKNTDTVNGVYEFLIQNHFDRHDLMIALGGGVVGDLTGFTAATTCAALILSRYRLHFFPRLTAALAARPALISCSIRIWSEPFISRNLYI